METNKIRTTAYLSAQLRDDLSRVAEEDACSESAVVTQALVKFFRERESLVDHVRQERMFSYHRDLKDFGQGLGYQSADNFPQTQGSKTTNSQTTKTE